ncbi:MULTISPECIES: hypothetical protein [Flavobacteriaceae]|uniref:Uncharacterized protein n=2 Tax=Flavobacteriaceae TaxID=49546 RepID=A0A4Y8ATC1_9FLAO|nr:MULTISPECIES: hypothetical protein [Flavobacteriaceae]TEW75124.1 hypothetical protein E2488_06270 [Gramella jeungdoensis]GGK41383.1 hypothetical protein GCM10007963_06760 [Lutibacter litoralis]
MERKIFEVKYGGSYKQPEHLKDLVKLFIDFENKFKFVEKIKVTIDEIIISDTKYINKDSFEILDDGKRITCQFYGNRYRGPKPKYKLNDAPNLFSHIKSKLEVFLKDDLERFEELNTNQEEE